MAKPGRIREIEHERGESFDTLVPRLLDELGSIPKVARVLGVSERTLFVWVKSHGYTRKISWIKKDSTNSRMSKRKLDSFGSMINVA